MPEEITKSWNLIAISGRDGHTDNGVKETNKFNVGILKAVSGSSRNLAEFGLGEVL